MCTESRKIHLIEELLKTDDDAVLSELETVFQKARPTKKTKKPSIYDFLGRISAEDAAKMSRAIEETSEIIHPDDWK